MVSYATAVGMWRNLLALDVQGVELPPGVSTARDVAGDDDIVRALRQVATTIDMVLTGTPMPPRRPEFTLWVLLLVTDYVRALPPLAPEHAAELRTGFGEMVTALRSAGDAPGDHEGTQAANEGARLLDGRAIRDVPEAIRLLTRAVELLPARSRERVLALGNLGSAYGALRRGDAGENWQQARELLEQACAATDRRADSDLWARAHSNLAYLLLERPGGATGDDVEDALGHFQLALAERSPERDRVDWSYSQMQLAVLYGRRGQPGDRERQERCYREVLAHLGPDDDAELWAAVQGNLADMLVDGGDVDGATDTATAALRRLDQDTYPVVAARLWRVLARAAERRSDALSYEAIRCQGRAVRLLRPELTPELFLELAGQLAGAYSQLGEWHAAAEVYEGMVTAFDVIYNDQLTREGRVRVMGGTRLARWASYAFARVGWAARAVEVIEQGRARELGTTARRDAADLGRLRAANPALADEYADRMADYHRARRSAEGSRAPGAMRAVVDAERAIRRVVEDIRESPGFGAFLRPVTVDDIAGAAGGLPVVYLVNSPAGSYVLTVVGGAGDPSVRASRVDAVTSTTIIDLAILDRATGEPGFMLAQQNATLMEQALPALLTRLSALTPLIDAVARLFTAPPGRPHDLGFGDEGSGGRAEAAVVIPTGLLGLVPLVAVPTSAGTLLDDVGEIRLAPSAMLYSVCERRASTPRDQHLVALADTVPTAPLPGSRLEVAAIAAAFEHAGHAVDVAGAGDADMDWLSAHMGKASHLHFSCHGRSDFADPHGGHLYLAGGAVLRMGDLASGQLACRVAVASACQSAHFSLTSPPDEVLGLPSGFLEAGAACAVATLWPVPDTLAAVMMAKFYELLRLGRSTVDQAPGAALRATRRWMRGLSPGELLEAIAHHLPFTDHASAEEGVPAEASRGQARAADLGGTAAAWPHWAAFVSYGC